MSTGHQLLDRSFHISTRRLLRLTIRAVAFAAFNSASCRVSPDESRRKTTKQGAAAVPPLFCLA
jgi:hypothetical protein